MHDKAQMKSLKPSVGIKDCSNYVWILYSLFTWPEERNAAHLGTGRQSPTCFPRRELSHHLCRQKSVLPKQGSVLCPHHRYWLQMGGALPICRPRFGVTMTFPIPLCSEAVSPRFLSAECSPLSLVRQIFNQIIFCFLLCCSL